MPARGRTKNAELSVDALLRIAGVSGMEVMTKAVQKAAKEFKIDAASLKDFDAASRKAAEQFYDIVGGAKATGLTADLAKSLDKYEDFQQKVLTNMVEAAEYVAILESQASEEDKKAAQASLDAVREEVYLKQKQMDREAEAMNDLIKKRTEALDALDRFARKSKAEKVQTGFELAEDFGTGLSKLDPTDLRGMAKSFGKAMGMAKEMMGGAAGKGGGQAAQVGAAIGPELAAAAGAMAAVAAVLAVVVALLLQADKKTKEFNKSILEGAGAADFAYDDVGTGIEDLEGSLDAVRESSMAVAWEFRQDAKEVMGIVAAANEAGLTFKEIEQKLSKTGDRMEAYGNLTRTAVIYSKTLGVSTKEIAETSAQWMRDYGMGLDNITAGFDAIFAGALQTGMGVKRFFGMVTQATAGLALYNNRIETTAALMAELSESLGEAGASEFVKGLQKGFAGDSYQDRFKKILQVGQPAMKEIFEGEAKMAAQSFNSKLTAAGEDAGGEIRKSLEAAGIKLGGGPEALASAVTAMATMDDKKVRALLTTARGKDDALAMQLETFITLSKGTMGGITETAKALDAMGPGGKLAMQLEAAQSVIGKPLSEMGGIELAYFEQMTGIGGEQLMELIRVDRQMRGNWEALEGMKGMTEEQLTEMKLTKEEQVKQFSAFIRTNENGSKSIVQAQIKNGKIIEGSEIENLRGYLIQQGEAMGSTVTDPLMSQTEMTRQIVKNTESIFKSMDTIVSMGFEKIADLLQMLYDWTIGGRDKEFSKDKEVLIGTLEAMKEKMVDAQYATAGELKVAQEELAMAQASGDTAKIKAAEDQVKLLEGLITTSKEEQVAVEDQIDTVRRQATRESQEPPPPSGEMEVIPLDTRTEQEKKLAEYGFDEATVARMTKKEDVGIYGTELTKAEQAALSPDELAKLQEKGQLKALKDSGLAGMAKSYDEWAAMDETERKKQADKAPSQFAQGMKEWEAGKIAGALGSTPEEMKGIYEEVMGGGLSRAHYQKGMGLGMEELIKPYKQAENAPIVSRTGGEQDFIYRGGAGGGVITPIDKADQLLGGKAGGPVTEALAAGGGGGVIININGGDTAQIYDTVKRAMRESGVRPTPGGR